LENGINAFYLAFETSDIRDAVKGMKALGIKGLSVTIPYKSDVIALLDEVDDMALKIGAVNTILNRNGYLKGYNTDAVGALKALEEKVGISGKSCLIIGAGGAARAVGYILKEKGLDVIVANRSIKRGESLCRDIGCEFIPLTGLEYQTADILINTTPLGMSPETGLCPVPEKVLNRGMVVMDIIYNPIETRLIKMATSRDCLTINGLGMFVHQGAEQFRLWTGLDAPISVMTEAVEKLLRD
jgi:shikimate dehydrogenase